MLDYYTKGENAAMKRILPLFLCFLMLVGMVLPVSAQSLPKSAGLTEEEWGVLFFTNRERIKEGLNPVSSTPFLQQVCDTRGKEISESFSHTRPNGSSCFSALEELGYSLYASAGENIAAGYTTPAEVVDGWMNSPGHRANILSPSFMHMGTGYYRDNSKSYVHYWVQFFYTGFNCSYTSMKLAGSSAVAADCSSIDDAGLTLALECDCGTCYLPLMKEFCTGFVPGRAGKQTLTVSCYGLTEKLSINVAGEDKPQETPMTFTDVPRDIWYTKSVDFAVSRGLMNGVGNGRFDPEGSMTRAMLVTVLWRYEGSPKAGTNGFSDVQNGKWFTNAIAWASENGIVNGEGNGKFNPDGNVTRQQMAAILFRYAQKKGFDPSRRGKLTDFADHESVSRYAVEPMQWAVAEGILNGSGGKLLLGGDATRAQVATVLMRYIQNIAEA